jgi:hypothetical protein
LPLRASQSIPQAAIYFRNGHERPRKSVNGDHLQVISEFFPQGDPATPVASCSSVVGKAFGKEILEIFLGRQRAASSKQSDMTVVVVEGRNLKDPARAKLFFRR